MTSPQPDDEPNSLDSLLSTGLKRLSSEVLIFLVLYTAMLLFTMRVASIDPVWQTLLILIPVIGIGGHIYLQRRKLMGGVRVRVGRAIGDAQVTGDQGPGAGKDAVAVAVGSAEDRARVVGIDRVPEAVPPDEGYLLSLFRPMSPEQRSELMKHAIALSSDRG